MLDGLAVGQFVECFVGDGASGELTQDRGRGASVEPSASVAGPLGRGQRPVEGLPVGRDGAGVVGEQFVQPLRDRAASAPPVSGAGRVGRSRGSCARTWSGRVQARTAARRGFRRGADATWPQPAQRAQRCLQAWHQGWPVAWEITHGAVAAADRAGQDLHAVGTLPHSGPSRCADADRAAATAVRRRFPGWPDR